MRAHLLKQALDAAPTSIGESEPCAACRTPGERKLFDRLASATGQMHYQLHDIQARARTMRDFRRQVDRAAAAKGRTIDWNKTL